MSGPDDAPPAHPSEVRDERFWPLALARELDDAVLWLRHDELEIGTWLFHSRGDLDRVLAFDALLDAHPEHWLMREVRLYWKRLLKRLDVTGRSRIALVEPGSCFAGTLLELVLGADRSYMLSGGFEDEPGPPAEVVLGPMNFGPCPSVNGLVRIAMRYPDDEEEKDEGGVPRAVREAAGRRLDAGEAEALRLVTFAPDDIDWEDEVRVAVEERASYSPDALVGMEASLRFPGPRDDGVEDIRAAQRVAELDLPAAQRDRGAGRAQSLRNRPGAGFRSPEGMTRRV